MWTGFISYFTNTNPNSSHSTSQPKDDDVKDWVFVDKSGHEICKEDIETKNQLDDSDDENAEIISTPRLSPLPLLDITNKDCSSDDSPSLSPSKMEDGWYITPPPCFTVACPTLEVSPLEDLLIEHPSMSVYSTLPNYLLRPFSLGRTPSLEATVEEEFPLVDKNVQTEFPKLPKVRSCAAVSDTPCKDVYSKVNELKDLIDQNENRKPSQVAKYRKEQYKLRPSFLHRQNLVCSVRNSFNSKKKGVVKPFGEKCKRSF